MSIVTFGPLVTGARGTIAGTIFSANKSGPYARGWNRGPNPRTSNQTSQRRTTGYMSGAWRSLTQLQRDAWDTWAALPAQEKFNSLGESYFPSGFNWFVCINTRLSLVGRALRVSPPVAARPAAPTILITQFRETPAIPESLVAYVVNEFVGFDLHLEAAIADSVGVLNKTHGWRVMLSKQNPHANFEEFQPELEAAFGDIQLLQRGFIRLYKQTTDGLRSSPDSGFNDVS